MSLKSDVFFYSDLFLLSSMPARKKAALLGKQILSQLHGELQQLSKHGELHGGLQGCVHGEQGLQQGEHGQLVCQLPQHGWHRSTKQPTR